MTLLNVIDTIKMFALKHPNINSAYEGNIYDIMNANPQQKYASVVLTQQSHTQDDMYDHYGFNIFYIDRLVDDLEENRLQIQSTGKSMLSNIIKAFCEEFDAECDNISYQTFTERFVDECAGVFCTIVIDMVKDAYCTEKYWNESWVTPMIVVRNQDKSVEFTANGTYTIDYDATQYSGLGKVEVEVNVPDLNGSYRDGYNDGKRDGIVEGYGEGIEDGYIRGEEAGIKGQKAKLESITITENGTYTKEDGYNEIVVEVPDLNGSYDEGYSKGIEEGTSNAGAIIAETAQVMNITENGTYVTKYSKPEDFGREITGYFDDGTPFYNYALLNAHYSKTDITLQPDSVVEIWVKPDGTWSVWETGSGIFAEKVNDNAQKFCIRINNYNYQEIAATINGTTRTVKCDIEQKWYHFVLSEAGLFIDGEKVTDSFDGAYIKDEYLYILGGDRNTASYCGMIKVTSNGVTYTIIPTENGFKNITTDTLLEVVRQGTYEYNGLPEFEGNLARTVNVNIPFKVNMEQTKLNLAYTTITEVPEWVDWTGIKDMANMFRSCINLTTISLIDTSSVTNMDSMFHSCSSLTSIPQLDTSNVTDMSYMFYGCNKIVSIPPLNAGKVTTITNFFSYSNVTTLTDFGGLIGLKVKWNDNYCLSKVPNLTYESCINVLNGLYDFTGNGETPTSSQGILKVHANFLTTVGDDINIGIQKGWIITA